MATGTETVHDRIDVARIELRPRQVLLGVALLVLVGTALVAAQDPALHDGLHNFRHVSGVTCH